MGRVGVALGAPASVGRLSGPNAARRRRHRGVRPRPAAPALPRLRRAPA
jgi:hypothetical protein